MMLFSAEKEVPNCNKYMFEGQDTVQMIFVLIALICIPWMLLGKPIYLMTCGRAHRVVSI
jgi:V-type H+-transporting ATPase subunit a